MTTQKNIVRTYSKKSSERNERECYLTPISIVQQFLEVEKFDEGSFLECCSNKEKHIEKTLKNNGYNNVYSNVFEEDGIDFLKWDEDKKYDYIVSNTPYKNSNDFIIKCMKVSKKKFCLLYPLDYCNGIFRYENIFNNNLGWKLSKMYIYVRKVMLEKELIHDEGLYYRTGLGCYCWYVFEKDYEGETITKWIDNNKYVLGSRDCPYRYDNKNKKIILKKKK